jgi:hypothetical protein
MEHWKPTRWRAYEVSDEYHVRSRNRVVKGKAGSSRFIAGRLLTPVLRHGIACVDLWRGNHRDRVRVDALVNEAFGPAGRASARSFAEAFQR